MSKIDDIIRIATIKSEEAAFLEKHTAKMRQLPWYPMKDATPQDDSDRPHAIRRTYIVQTDTANQLYVAYYGFLGQRIWVSTSGMVLTAEYGHNVIQWCPLPVPDFETDSTPPIPNSIGGDRLL